MACLGLAMLLSACPDGPGGDDASDDGADTRDATTGAPDTDVIVLPPDCTVDADCDPDGALPACLTVACDAGECVLADADDGTACDDGDLCTGADQCVAGTCVGSSDGCDDGNECTTDGCDPAFGCVYTHNQRPCDDGDGCTSADRCFQGSCGGEALDCDDQNDCTDDSCDDAVGCVNAPREGECDDGDACTVGDACVSGTCAGGAPRVCGDASDPCQSATCDPVEGCQVQILSGPCQDGDACTIDDICVEGVCAGELVTCNDDNPCTDDYCDMALGCTTVDNVLPCDDADPCTLVDTCSSGACGGTGVNPLCCGDEDDCDDGDPCTTDACADGLCQFIVNDCDDANPCTADECDGGACTNVAWGPIAATPTLVDDFEVSAAAWTVTSTNAMVGWQRDTSMAHAGGASFYLGHVPDYSYDFGHTLARAQRVLAIPPGTPTLSLWYLADLAENDSCNFDVVRVFIGDVQLTPAICSSVDDWTEQTWDLAPFSGSTVTLALEFDTLDGTVNDGAGVWVDDVTLTVADPPACCLDATDCAGNPNMTCAVPSCPDARCALDTSACQ